jgi:hypothetical protein
LTEAYLERIVTLEEYRRRRRELEERQEAIEAQMRQLEARIDRKAGTDYHRGSASSPFANESSKA